ncbi:MAG: diguanylate cyclase [Dehalococcoidia bacterium]|jgi:diguanylate cyclase (GGDEF)-like protein
MSRTLRQWFRNVVEIPEGPERRYAITRRAVLVLVLILLIAEGGVALRYSGTIGLILMASTAGLSAFVVQGVRALSPSHREASGGRDNAGTDPATGLPTRAQLIDTLSRDIARSERYSHALTLAVVRVSQFEEMRGSWGAGTAKLAIEHVVETLGRITRASDFVARLDESTFAVTLLQCSGRQAGLYADRLVLAVSNRPLKSTSSVKVPLYVGVEVNAVEYDATRFRGPLDFLSVAGGDLVPERPRALPSQRGVTADSRGLRQQLVKDYYPGGEMKDFADAYKEARNRNRHAG